MIQCIHTDWSSKNIFRVYTLVSFRTLALKHIRIIDFFSVSPIGIKETITFRSYEGKINFIHSSPAYRKCIGSKFSHHFNRRSGFAAKIFITFEKN